MDRSRTGCFVSLGAHPTEFYFMKKYISAALVFAGLILSCQAQLTTQEKLGYPATAKLLIIHADDLGVSHSENQATIQAMEKGSVNSASIMVPCPWFSEIATYATTHPQADFGLHLTLTSEWKYYKWAGLTGATTAPGLHNKFGFLFASVDSVYRAARLQEVEKELRAQIDKALAAGIDVTHFDSHMAALFGRHDYLKLLISLGREYRVPVLLTKDGPRSPMDTGIKAFLTDKDVQLDQIYTATPADYKSGMNQFYEKVLRSLQPGISELIIHTAYDDKEMQAVTIDHPDWGAAWRQADLHFFTSAECRKILAEQNIILVTWRELRDKIVRK